MAVIHSFYLSLSLALSPFWLECFDFATARHRQWPFWRLPVLFPSSHKSSEHKNKKCYAYTSSIDTTELCMCCNCVGGAEYRQSMHRCENIQAPINTELLHQFEHTHPDTDTHRTFDIRTPPPLNSSHFHVPPTNQTTMKMICGRPEILIIPFLSATLRFVRW